MKYEYCKGDLLLEPQKYQYTQFQGKAFIEAWQESRQSLEIGLPSPERLSLTSVTNGSNTQTKLQQICSDMRTKHGVNNIDAWLLIFLKKFEVSKRLYGKYSTTPPHRCVDKSDFLALTPYLLFAEALILACHREHQMYYLSALLKLVDSLGTQVERMTRSESGQFAWILQQESILIGNLSKRLKV